MCIGATTPGDTESRWRKIVRLTPDSQSVKFLCPDEEQAVQVIQGVLERN